MIAVLFLAVFAMCEECDSASCKKGQLLSNSSVMSHFRFLSFRNLSVCDEAIVDFLEVTDGLPLSVFSLEGVTLTGEGRYEAY